jgi:hypothetical protein
MQTILEEVFNERQKLAMCCGLYGRLGAQSSVRWLDSDSLRNVFNFSPNVAQFLGYRINLHSINCQIINVINNEIKVSKNVVIDMTIPKYFFHTIELFCDNIVICEYYDINLKFRFMMCKIDFNTNKISKSQIISLGSAMFLKNYLVTKKYINVVFTKSHEKCIIIKINRNTQEICYTQEIQIADHPFENTCEIYDDNNFAIFFGCKSEHYVLENNVYTQKYPQNKTIHDFPSYVYNIDTKEMKGVKKQQCQNFFKIHGTPMSYKKMNDALILRDDMIHTKKYVLHEFPWIYSTHDDVSIAVSTNTQTNSNMIGVLRKNHLGIIDVKQNTVVSYESLDVSEMNIVGRMF